MCSHKLTVLTPLTVAEKGDNTWSVKGTPADCVRIALFGLNLDVDLIVSGINFGGNLGQDTVVSGTVAAAREGAYHGIPSIAISQFLRSYDVNWETTEKLASKCLNSFGDSFITKNNGLWNFNLPNLATDDELAKVQIIPSTLEEEPIPVSFEKKGNEYLYNGSYPDRGSSEGSDVATCFGGDISLSWLPI